MIVVGGTYDEIVVQPDSVDMVGSGVRAAAALSRTDSPPTLVTAVDRRSSEEADLVASALGVNRSQVFERSERVGFKYMTPISAPSINGLGAHVEGQVEVAESTVLAFGFIETWTGPACLQADRVVLDPQKPRDTEPIDLQAIDARELVIVANRSETLQLGGQASDLHLAAMQVLEATRAHAVISKRGAAGALVTWRASDRVRQDAIAAHSTSRVWPIGSGDVFSAGLAYALDRGASPVEAAEVGSRSAAHWCSTRRSDIPDAILRGGLAESVVPPRSGRVYLAGPFFSLGERWLVEVVRDELRALGVDVWSPVHEVGHGDDIAQADIQGLQGCDAVLALLDHSDSGTIFEVGWAVAHQIPVVGYGQVVEREGMKMLGGTTVELHRDLSTACYRAAWAAMGMETVPGWMTR